MALPYSITHLVTQLPPIPPDTQYWDTLLATVPPSQSFADGVVEVFGDFRLLGRKVPVKKTDFSDWLTDDRTEEVIYVCNGQSISYLLSRTLSLLTDLYIICDEDQLKLADKTDSRNAFGSQFLGAIFVTEKEYLLEIKKLAKYLDNVGDSDLY